MTLKLCGFSASNYYGKLKLQLLEKQVPFEEELVWVGNTHPKLMDRSPEGCRVLQQVGIAFELDPFFRKIGNRRDIGVYPFLLVLSLQHCC